MYVTQKRIRIMYACACRAGHAHIRNTQVKYHDRVVPEVQPEQGCLVGYVCYHVLTSINSVRQHITQAHR